MKGGKALVNTTSALGTWGLALTRMPSAQGKSSWWCGCRVTHYRHQDISKFWMDRRPRENRPKSNRVTKWTFNQTYSKKTMNFPQGVSSHQAARLCEPRSVHLH